MGRKLSKDTISVEIAAFGDLSDTQREKLTEFHKTLSATENSSLTFIETGLNFYD